MKAESVPDSPDKVIRELEKGRHYPCYLIYGEDEFLIKDVVNRIVDLLIPSADRDLNLITVNGEE
ncbi:MAG: hypothetical protein PHN75_01415, partial [Syntrophales bacterium]|nr:hypothetical protein [Syntrophales bacterium]